MGLLLPSHAGAMLEAHLHIQLQQPSKATEVSLQILMEHLQPIPRWAMEEAHLLSGHNFPICLRKILMEVLHLPMELRKHQSRLMEAFLLSQIQ
jgi:hypothetical protein